MKKPLIITDHAEERMALRHICRRDIFLAVSYGDAVRSGKTVVYELHNMCNFSGKVFPAPLVALVQKREVLVVIVVTTARRTIIKTAYWKPRGKNSGGNQ